MANCPYRMSDGRNFTDYRPRCAVAYEHKTNNNFKSNYEQRQYLIHNANKLMSQGMTAAERSCSGGCFKPTEVGTMLPEKNMVQCNKKTCQFNEVNANGVGTGRKYA